MNCPRCGSFLPDNTRFCTNCGLSLTPPQTVPPQPPKKNPWPYVLIGVLSLILIGAIVTIILLLADRNKKPDTQPQIPSESSSNLPDPEQQDSSDPASVTESSHEESSESSSKENSESSEPAANGGEADGIWVRYRTTFNDGSYELFDFDSQGNAIRCEGYGMDGHLNYTIDGEYFADGKKAAETLCFIYNYEQPYYQYVTYDYNEAGMLRIMYTQYNPENVQVTEYTYDGELNLIREVLSTEGEVISQKVYEYMDGMLYAEVFQDEVGEGNCTYIYHYNDLGQLIEKDFFDKDQQCTSYMLYAYDEKGNLRETLYYADGILNETDTYSYDEHNNLIREDVTINGTTYTTIHDWKLQ